MTPGARTCLTSQESQVGYAPPKNKTHFQVYPPAFYLSHPSLNVAHLYTHSNGPNSVKNCHKTREDAIVLHSLIFGRGTGANLATQVQRPPVLTANPNIHRSNKGSMDDTLNFHHGNPSLTPHPG